MVDLEKLGNLDLGYPGMEIGAELTAVRYHLSALVDFLPTIQDQFRVRAEHKLHNVDRPDDAYDELLEQEHIDHVAESVLPRMFRSPYLISIWAMYESGVIDLTNYIKDREGAALPLSDIRGNSLQNQLEKYWRAVLKIDMPISKETFEKLGEIHTLRNLLAHRNGRLSEIDDSRKIRIRKIVDSRTDLAIEDGVLTVGQSYLSFALDVIVGALADIDSLCASRYETINLIDRPPGRET